MALDDGIRESYRVSGISKIGSGYVFARLRVKRKAGRHEGGEQEPEQEPRRQNQESSDGQKHIDIKA
jgi:hypothetical protein